MSKKLLYLVTLTVFAALIVYVAFKFHKKTRGKEVVAYPVLERKGSFVQTAEWSTVRQKASRLAEQFKKDPPDQKSLLALTAIYLQEGRISGNHSYYNMAAMQCVNRILSDVPGNFEALTFKSMILLSQHQFSQGLKIAENARQINPSNAFVYGLLVDGNVETGNYETAVENSDKMVSIRPDIRSYSRIAYLREIYGDNEGAIEAMKLAVDAGPPGDEGTEWSRIQLGRLYELGGNLEMAEREYLVSNQYRPGYPYALAGLARILSARKKYQLAMDLYRRADSTIYDFSIQNEIGELYLLKGQKDSADSVFRTVLKEMAEFHNQSGKEESNEHYADLELAYAWLRVNNYAEALEHALIEFNRRPGNIEVNEALAWVYYCRGDYSKALTHIKVALRTNCKNPVLLCKAGLIFARNDETARGFAYFREAMKNNPAIPSIIKEESKKVFSKELALEPADFGGLIMSYEACRKNPLVLSRG